MTWLPLLIALGASDPKPVVSVLYFDNRSGGAELDVMRKGFAEMVITDLVAWDGVTVVDRGRLEDVLKELKLQGSVAFDKSTAVKVGKLVGAQYAITGSLNVAQGKLRVDANVTGIEKGDIVASASATDEKDKVFDVEQQLVDGLTQAIDWKLKNRDARKKAKVPNFEALVAYSKAIDLSDQGKLDEAQKAMAALVSKSPTFLMAREKKQQLLEMLKAYEARKKDLISAGAADLGRRADQELAKGFASLKPSDQRAFLFWRQVKSRFLARVLKQSLSSRDESLRVVRPGQEAKALEVMKGWVENQRRLLEEAAAYQKLENNDSLDVEKAGLFEPVRDSAFFAQDGQNFSPDSVTNELYRFVIEGRITDGVAFHVAPGFSVLVPAELEAVLKSMEQDAARAEAAYARATDKSRLEWPLAKALTTRAEALEYLRRDDDAAAAYQKVLDLLPTSDQAKRAEAKIQTIIGTQHDWGRGEREKYEKAIRDCDDWYVNTEIGWRLRRKGLAGLDEIAQDMEKACFGRPGSAMHWSRFYDALASDAATHEDCERAKKYHLKSFTFGDKGPRSFDYVVKNEAWCNHGFSEDTFPSKVRVTHVSEGDKGNATLAAVFPGLEDLVAEELGARGVAIEWGGSSNGGVLGLWVSLQPKGDSLVLTGKLGDGIELSVPVKGAIDWNAFFAPALKALKGKSDPGPRKPSASISLEQAAAYGKAVDLYNDRKWKEAKDAFDALAKKSPALRLAVVRAQMSAAKLTP